MDAKDLVGWALEASLFFEPRRPGLTLTELAELATQFGVTPSALDNQLRGRATEGGRVAPFGVDPGFFATYEGDLRNVAAFDHVLTAFKQIAEAAGQRPPIVSREALVASATAAGLPAADVELAVALYRAFEGVPEADDRWELRRIKPTFALPSVQRSGPGKKVARRERYGELVERVRQLIDKRPGRGAAPAPARAPAPLAARAPAPAPAPVARPVVAPAPATRAPAPAPVVVPRAPPARDEEVAIGDPFAEEPEADAEPESEETDGTDPLAAFKDIMPSLGQGRLVAWWAQLSRDLRAADDRGAQFAKALLSATMAEAALLMVLPRPPAPKPDSKAKPPRWTLPEAARAASSIGVDEILRTRLERAHRLRLRANVTKVMEASGPLHDVTIQDARDAYKAMCAVVRHLTAYHLRRQR
jgi:hypothetical protein